MRYWFRSIIFSLFLMLLGCQPSQPKETSAPKPEPKPASVSQDPFQGATAISLISMNTEDQRDSGSTYYYLSRSNYIDKHRFNREVMLNTAQKAELKGILQEPGPDASNKTDCYSPKHAILFYNQDLLPYAFIEIAFPCRGYRVAEGYGIQGISSQAWADLEAFFRKQGFNKGF